MDASTSELLNLREEEKQKDLINKRKEATALRKRLESQRKRKVKLREREVLKMGMTSSLTVAILTGIKVMKPMRLHPVAGWIFLGFTLAHLLTNSKKPARR